MPIVTQISKRKADHLEINLTKDVSSGLGNGLDRFRFTHEALPEINFSEVDTTTQLFGKRLYAPIFISSMTGGTKEAESINLHLAEAAQECKIPMALGSLRAALEDPKQIRSFQIRKIAPDILVFANIGAIQLNNGLSIDDCQRLLELVEADGLILHLNPLQEALQVGGDTNFSGLQKKIEFICKKLSKPVIVKEVGWGISKRTASMLKDCGVSAIDVAGAGGTSWSQVEMYRSQNEEDQRIASDFKTWGISTAESIINVNQAANGVTIIASGGISNGIEIAKCIALGAGLVGCAGYFLKPANISAQEVIRAINSLAKELSITMFSTGSKSLNDLASKLSRN